MGNKPYIVPYKNDKKASFAGIPYTIIATNKATSAVNRLALNPFIFFMINAQKINMIGAAATKAERPMLCIGSMICVQFK